MTAFTAGSAVKAVFFGNYFYGLCAIALAVEASLQQRLPLNSPLFYTFLFTVTVLYYSMAYLNTEQSPDETNLRSVWYARNRKAIFVSQYALLLLFLFTGAILFIRHWRAIAAMSGHEWFLLLVFPLVSAFYYGFTFNGKSYNIRNAGWLKPFVIGFTWAGLVNIYPVLFLRLGGLHANPGEPAALFLFVKNMMFIAVLCIMFDIKDYEMDYNKRLKTFVVNLGPRRTIWLIIFPLAVLGLVSFLFYAVMRDFTCERTLINVIPFAAVIATALSLRRPRSIFYYLVVIDGLMLLKAACGISAMLLFA